MQTILIPKPALFSFDECLWFLNRSYDDCLHHITETSVTKAVIIDGQPIVITLTQDVNDIVVHVETGTPDENGIMKLKAYVEDWFDMKRDLQPFNTLLENHQLLGYMAKDYNGLRLLSIPDIFEALCWSIIGQQINLTFAYKLKRILVETYGGYTTVNGIKHYTFPKPASLATLSIDDLKALQFSKQKADYIINISKLFTTGSISKQQLLDMPTEEKLKTLTALKGVGTWTANYVIMKALRDMSGIPHGDVGMLKALEQHALIEDRKDATSIEKVFNEFRGWESYLVHYLWRSLAVIKE